MKKWIKSLSEAKELIENKITELKNSGKRDIAFIGFISEEWKGIEKTRIKIRCNTHNITVETSYRGFMRRKSWGCPKCRIDDKKKSWCLCLTKEDAIIKVNNKIKELKDKGIYDLEFLGFVDEFFSTDSRKVHLIIQCKIHNKIGHPRMDEFLRKGFCCNDCRLEKSSNSVKLTNLEMYARLSHKFGDNYDFSPILKETFIKGSVYNKQIKFICKEHGESSLTYSRLINTNTLPCNKCMYELKRIEREKVAIKKIVLNTENKLMG